MTQQPVHSFGYGRCSKSEEIQANTRDAQEAAVQAFHDQELAPKGVRYQGMFFDPWVSASKVNFPNRQAAAALTRQMRKGDHFIVARLDRAFRNIGDGATTLDTLHKRGVIVHVLDCPVDSSTWQGEMWITMSLMFARWESRIMSERTRAGLQSKIRRDFPVGGRYAPIGWKITGRRKRAYYEIHQEERATCRRVAELRATHSFAAIHLNFAQLGLAFRGKTRVGYGTVVKMVGAAQRGFPLPSGNLVAGRFDDPIENLVEAS